MNFAKSLILIGCDANRKAKFSKKNLLLSSHKGDEAETLYKCCVIILYINYFFIAVGHVVSLLWQLLSFHRFIMGKVKVGLYFYLTLGIFKVLH